MTAFAAHSEKSPVVTLVMAKDVRRSSSNVRVILVNRKKVLRLWRQDGLLVRGSNTKRRRHLGTSSGELRSRATAPNEVWSVDFAFDRTMDGRPIKIFAIIDEFTRECLTLEVARKINSEGVITAIEQASERYGLPRHLRSDNGPEFVAKNLAEYCKFGGTSMLFIEPGAPWQNGYVESFNGRFRGACLSGELFESLRHARAVVAAWQDEYNHHRPHSSLGGLTPTSAREAWTDSQTTSKVS